MAYTKTEWNNGTLPYINGTNLKKIEQGIYDNDKAIEKTTNVIGYDEYDSTSTYNVGDYCIYNNKLYVCNTAIATAEEFNSEHWTETSINGIIESVKSDVATNTSKIETITTGTGIANTTYINNVENNHWEKVGHVVSYAFTMRATGTWSSTTEFITGLPKPKAATRFIGVNSSNSSSPTLRFVITADGTIQNAYSQSAPTANQNIEGQITYITTE